MKKTYYVKTFGCQQNKSDSERVRADYEARGYSEVDDWREASEIVVNTCAIRQAAEDKAKGFLLNVVKHFEALEKARPKIIVTGCMTHHGEKKLLELLPMVDEILPVNEVGFNQGAIRRDKVHAWVPISTGCNSFCTYCIVPYSRGREQSRPMEEIMMEVAKLHEQGYKELTLLGMNVNSWGLEKVGIGLRKLLFDKEKNLSVKDIPANQTQYSKPDGTPPFVRLLQEISQFKNIKKIRFITSNPWDFHDELIAEIATNQKIDRYIHLPIQSGSNTVLKRMNRGYTREDYIELVRKLRQQIKDVVIGTDIIVGFPGETNEEFEETVTLAKAMDWKVAFVARYSPRPGTAAWKLWEDNVDPQEKKRRWEVLDQITNKDNLSNRPIIV